MKDSKEYSKKIRKLYTELKRKHGKVAKVSYEDVLEALVYSLVSEYLPEKEAAATIKGIAKSFIDLNDLRVSLTAEIIEVLGSDTRVTRQVASNLTTALRSVFTDQHCLSLESLKKMGKRPARALLGKLEGISDYAADYCMLTSLGGHAIPLNQKMIDYLREEELVHPQADEQEIAGFLTRQISAKNGYEFYALLRKQSEVYVTRKKSKKKVKKTVKKKSTKKVKAKSVKEKSVSKKTKAARKKSKVTVRKK